MMIKMKVMQNKKIAGILFVVIGVLLSLFGTIAYSEKNFTDDRAESQFQSRYVVENLKGERIFTWKSWNIPQDVPLVVNFVNSEIATVSQIEAAKRAIISEEVKYPEDHLHHNLHYYAGWLGALKSITEPTKYHIPDDIQIITSEKREGNVLIEFVPHKEGYTGYTKSIVDGDQILKSHITIFDVNNLEEDEMEAIVRHEFGHALGLAHSTDSRDIMFPVIDTDKPLISECVITGLKHLYNGSSSSEVAC